MRKILKSELNKVIAFANQEFNVDFTKIQPTFYNDMENYKYHYIYEVNNEILGMFMAKPLEYNQVKFLGIGTLCVKKEYRNKGIMKEMFDYMENELFPMYDVIYLAGERFRYERFGFYKAGIIYTLKIKNKNLNGLTDLSKITVTLLNKDNIDLIKKVNIITSYYVKRSINDLINIIQNVDYKIFLIESKEEKGNCAYCIYDESENSVYEINGQMSNKIVLKALMNELKIPKIYYCCNKSKTFTLSDVIDDCNQETLNSIKIINYNNVFEKLINFYKEKKFIIRMQNKDIIVRSKDGITKVKEIKKVNKEFYTEKEIITLLFGSTLPNNILQSRVMPLNESEFLINLPSTLGNIDDV